MTLDLDVSMVVQQAFQVSRANAQELSNTSLMVKSQKLKVEQIVRLLLEHLCDMNLVDINLDKMVEIGWIEAGKLADRATVILPSNQTERLAVEIKSAPPETLERICHYLDRDTRRGLLAILEELEQ